MKTKLIFIVCGYDKILIPSRQAVSLPLLEDENTGRYDHQESRDIIPFQILFQIENGKNTEYGEGDDFLNRLQFSSRKFSVTDSIRRDLEAILGESDHPANEDDPEQGS